MDDQTRDEAEPVLGLSEDEVDAVAQRKAGTAKVVHEVIRLQGDAGAQPPAGIADLFRFRGRGRDQRVDPDRASIAARLQDMPGRELIVALGYPVGFLLVIMGKMQLFTENTVIAVLPLATHPTLRNLGRILRLWAVVLLANLAGTCWWRC